MSRTLYVHLGPRKTGTTALQSVLRRHNGPGVIYPKVGLWPDGSHHGLVFRFFGNERKGKVSSATIGEMLDSIAATVASSDCDVLISSEALRVGQDIAGFVDAIAGCFPQSVNVEFLLVCREHFSRASSLYNHRVRSGERDTPDEFLEKRGDTICYAPILNHLRTMGHKITVLNYQPSDSLVQRFLTRIGWKEQDVPSVRARNQALSPKALVFKLAINRVVEDERSKSAFFAGLKTMRNSHAPSRFIFGRDVAEKIDRLYGEDRAFLQTEFGINIESRDLDRERNAFLIDEQDFAEIVEVAGKFEDSAGEIVRFVRQFVRIPSLS